MYMYQYMHPYNVKILEISDAQNYTSNYFSLFWLLVSTCIHVILIILKYLKNDPSVLPVAFIYP